MKPPTCIRFCFVFASTLAATGLTSCTSLVKTIDHRQDHWENADLWRRVKDQPAVFVPRAFGSKEELNHNKGDWIVDTQDQTAFFIPFADCGGLNFAQWRVEARKGVNHYTKAQQRAVNAATVLVGWPAYTALLATCAAAESYASR